ncbi:hypothetical protein E5D57_009308 [Metarhizium anisopliae]|nr:hypothetical protein E5D57_009308 [Metarhizium anisopliae]
MVRKALDSDKESIEGTYALGDEVTAVPVDGESDPPQSLAKWSDPEAVTIEFKKLENGDWNVIKKMTVNPSDPSEVTRVAHKYMRKKFGLSSSNGRALTPQKCFEHVTSNGTNAVYLTPGWVVNRSHTEESPRKCNKNN